MKKIRSDLLIGLVTPEEIKDWMGLVDVLDRKGSVLLIDEQHKKLVIMMNKL